MINSSLAVCVDRVKLRRQAHVYNPNVARSRHESMDCAGGLSPSICKLCCVLRCVHVSWTIQVCFVGESAVDTGGPAREFWRLLMVGLESDYCRSGEGGCFLERNVSAIQVHIYIHNDIYTCNTMIHLC